MRKKFMALAALVVLGCVMLTGCSSKLTPADQTVGALFKLAAMDDASEMKDLLGFASEEDVRSALMEEGSSDLVAGLEESFTGAGIEFSAEELDQMKEYILTLLRKMPYTVEITSEEKDKVVVSLKINGYSMADMQEIAMTKQQEAQAALSDEQLQLIAQQDEEATMEFMRTYMMAYMEGVSQMEPMADATEVTVECEKVKVDVSGKEKVVWMPADMSKFGTDVEAAVLQ